MEPKPYTLTPFDHAFPPTFYTVVAISFSLSQPQDAVPALQTGITALLNHLPFLTGAVAPSKSSTKANAMDIWPRPGDTSSILGIRYYPHYRLASIPQSPQQGTSDGESTPDLKPEFNYFATPAPIIRIQLNILTDGAIVCFAVNHMAIDGMGVGVLLDLLASCCRGDYPLPTDNRAQELSRQRIRTVSEAYNKTQPLQHDMNGRTPSNTLDGVFEFEPGNANATHNFVFADKPIKQLKRQCNALLRQQRLDDRQSKTASAQPSFVSSNDILTALLWICINQARSQSKITPCSTTAASQVSIPINVRNRFCPPLPSTYLGNAVEIGKSRLCLAQLACLDEIKQGDDIIGNASVIELLTAAACGIRGQIAKVDNEHLGQMLRQALNTTDWATLMVQPCDVVVSSLREWNVFFLDFGGKLGSVERLEFMAFFALEGECLVKPRRPGGGGGGGEGTWDVMVTLNLADMERLQQSPLLCWVLESDYSVELCRVS
ncbi:transferase family-domain-containing protein [Aspergillus spectabilis]